MAAAAFVVGGMRSIPLALIGGLVLGIAQNLVTGYAKFASNITGFNGYGVRLMFACCALMIIWS